MATMKYIGARYMPKFMGTYDATTAYEALSVVDNGAGTTYVANKPAPAGTPLSDTEYWSIYGASSGAILDLQTRLGTAENDISAIQSDITSLGNRVSATEDDLSLLKNRKYILIGDSYAASPEIIGSSWATYLKQRMALTEGTDVFTSVAGGYGFTIQNGTFLSLLQALDNVISDKDEITDILVAGMVNDSFFGSNSDLKNAITTFCTYAKSHYPNATVWLAYIGGCYMPTQQQCSKMHETIDICKNCVDQGIRYINNIEWTLHNGSMLTHDPNAGSNFHPSPRGNSEIADNLINGLRTGSVSVNYVQTGVCTEDASLISFLSNGVTGLQSIGMSRTNLTPFSISRGTWVDIAELNNTSTYYGNQNVPIVATVGLQLAASGAVYFRVGCVRCTQGKIQIKLARATSEADNNLTNIIAVQTDPFTLFGSSVWN